MLRTKYKVGDYLLEGKIVEIWKDCQKKEWILIHPNGDEEIIPFK